MEDTELEEGEVRPCQKNEDYNASIDPDTDRYHLDERLEAALGHFRKDFEGGGSCETSGALLDDHGSFLRDLQFYSQSFRFPSHPSALSSTNNLQVKLVDHQPGFTSSTSIPSSKASFVNDLSKQKVSCAEEFTSIFDSTFKRFTNVVDQNTLKVQIKVGTDNFLAQKNAENLAECEGKSHEPDIVPFEFPTSILQMTSPGKRPSAEALPADDVDPIVAAILMNAGAAFAHRPPRLTSDIRASKTARKTLISSPGGSSQASSPLVGGLIGPSSGQRGALASNEGALLDRLKAEMDKEMTQLAAGSMPLDLLDLGKMAMYAAHMDSCTDVVKITAQELSEQIIADCPTFSALTVSQKMIRIARDFKNMKAGIAAAQSDLHKAEAKELQLREEWVAERVAQAVKLHAAVEEGLKRKKAYEDLEQEAGRLVSQVRILKEQLENEVPRALGLGVKLGFKVCRQILLRLQPNFDIKALEALVTPGAVQAAAAEDEAENTVDPQPSSKPLSTDA